MKKGDFTHDTLPRMLIIGLVVIILLIGIPQILFGANKSLLKNIDSLLGTSFAPQEEDLTSLNQKATNNFDLLVNELKICIASKKVDCICKSQLGLNDFNSIHQLSINNNEFKLLFVDERNEITQREEKIDVKCYTTTTGIKQLTPEIRIKFDQDVPYLEDSKGEDAEFVNQTKDVLYKSMSGDICWLTNQRSLTGLSYCT